MSAQKHVFEELFFRKCKSWNTEQCPNLHNGFMQLSIVNAPHWFMLNDRAVDRLADMCKGCAEFKQN